MSVLPQISGLKLVKALKRDSWIEIHQIGSHLKMVKYLQPVGKRTIIVPMHKVLKKGTLAQIMKDSGVTLEKLKKLL